MLWQLCKFTPFNPIPVVPETPTQRWPQALPLHPEADRTLTTPEPQSLAEMSTGTRFDVNFMIYRALRLIGYDVPCPDPPASPDPQPDAFNETVPAPPAEPATAPAGALAFASLIVAPTHLFQMMLAREATPLDNAVTLLPSAPPCVLAAGGEAEDPAAETRLVVVAARPGLPADKLRTSCRHSLTSQRLVDLIATAFPQRSRGTSMYCLVCILTSRSRRVHRWMEKLEGPKRRKTTH